MDFSLPGGDPFGGDPFGGNPFGGEPPVCPIGVNRRYPDSNWGSKICNLLPYHLAISPAFSPQKCLPPRAVVFCNLKKVKKKKTEAKLTYAYDVTKFNSRSSSIVRYALLFRIKNSRYRIGSLREQFVKKLSARCYNPNRKSLVAFYGILCRLKVSETPFVTTVDDRVKLLKVLQELDFFGHNPINEEEISEIYKFFEKWKKSPKYPVNRLKRFIENLEDEIENIGPEKPEL
uniref:Uncharacterized protein n=1 Tax=Halimeda minima TaxID=170427 RepID=A0A386AYW9_9CHLO|nr:hypothetical protein [Halimeda minima]